MPMDHFMEEVVVKKQKGAQELAYYLGTVSMVIFAVAGFAMLSSVMTAFHLPTLLLTLLLIGTAALLFLRKDRVRTEYEYTFTNGDLDFARVYNNQKRQNLGTMRVKNVEAFGRVNSEGFHKLLHMRDLKRKNWFLNRGAELYYFYYQKERQRTIVVLEPSEALVEMIQKYLPHGALRA